ncbi:MAG: fatty acid desaturase [Rhodospirillaceae bacterium]|nr:fatty acid desaturase [Rhodospirillaceae bacterium]
MDEVVFRHPKLDRARVRALSARSDAKGLRHLAGHGALIAATAILVGAAGTPWLAPALLAHGAVLVSLFAPLHECIHRTAFRSVRLNDTVAWVCGAVLLLPPTWFRHFHFAHHRWTQDPERDPELAAPKPATLAAWLVHVSGLPYWRVQAAGLLRRAAGRVDDGFVPPRAKPAVVLEARLYLALYAGVAAVGAAVGTWAPVLYWIAPALLGQPLLRLYLLAEHTGCPLVADMLRNTRTTRTNAIVRFLAWNMPYHAEHHACPAVPFHALPALHAVLRDELGVVAPGYLAVQRELLAALRRDRAAGSRPAST